MKYLLIIASLVLCVLTATDCIQSIDNPRDCYSVTLIVDSNTGDIIKTSSVHVFIFDPAVVDAWQNFSGDVIRDSTNHTAVIELRYCLTTDTKYK